MLTCFGSSMVLDSGSVSSVTRPRRNYLGLQENIKLANCQSISSSSISSIGPYKENGSSIRHIGPILVCLHLSYQVTNADIVFQMLWSKS